MSDFAKVTKWTKSDFEGSASLIGPKVTSRWQIGPKVTLRGQIGPKSDIEGADWTESTVRVVKISGENKPLGIFVVVVSRKLT